MHSTTGFLTPRAPFDFAKSLAFLGEFMPTRNEQVVSDHTLTKAMMIEGQAIAFQLRSVGTIEQPKLVYTPYAHEPLAANIIRAAQDRIAFFLSLHDDLTPFYALARKDKPFAPIIEQLYGLHPVKFLTPFENACWAVLSQRTPIPVAQKAKQAVVEKYGECVPVDGKDYWAFPEASRLAVAQPAELVGLIGNERRAEYLSAVARAFDNVDEKFLREGDYEEVRQWLLNIKGIGEWSADFILLRGLGRMQQLHIQSTSIFEQRMSSAASKVYGYGLKREEVLKIAERYGEWQGYWAYYLRTAE